MESFLNRYRNITVLLLVICAQLILLAVQVKNEQNVRFIRVWTVTAVSPLARLVEALRGSSISFIHNYITLHDADAENRRLHTENDQLKLDVISLTNQLNRTENAKALQLFQEQSPSKYLAASVFSMGIGSSRKVLWVNRGSTSKVMREMAAVVADGIVGKVTDVYPTVSVVMLVTDPMFAAGVISGKTHARGTLKGLGTPLCKVDFVAYEDKVDVGDWFYTSGDDRIFPRGMPVGVVRSVRSAQPYKEILLDPSGLAHGSLEDLLIVIEGVHQEIPDTPPVNQQVYLAPPPPPLGGVAADAAPAADANAPATEADKARALYQKTADSENIVLGGGPTGQDIKRPPDFTKIPVDPRSAGDGRGGTSPMTPVQRKGTSPPLPTKGTAPDPKATPDAVRHANQANGGPGGLPQP